MIEALPTDKDQPMTADEVIRGDARYAILQGDALQQLRTLPDECVQCIVTSPPYYQLRSYSPDQVILDPSLPIEERARITAELNQLGIKPE